MKVRCVKLMRWDGTPVEGTTNGWLTLGKEYHVLAINGGKGPVATTYRVRTDDPSHAPVMCPAEEFKIISPEIPSGWVFELHSDREWSLEPAVWAEKGFWERYFDGDEAAKAVFDKEFMAITNG
jgi:hypothetical protein